MIFQLRAEAPGAGPGSPRPGRYTHPWPTHARRAQRGAWEAWHLISPEASTTVPPGEPRYWRGEWWAPVIRHGSRGPLFAGVRGAPDASDLDDEIVRRADAKEGRRRVEILPATRYGRTIPVVRRLMPAAGTPEEVVAWLEEHAAAVLLPPARIPPQASECRKTPRLPRRVPRAQASAYAAMSRMSTR